MAGALVREVTSAAKRGGVGQGGRPRQPTSRVPVGTDPTRPASAYRAPGGDARGSPAQADAPTWSSDRAGASALTWPSSLVVSASNPLVMVGSSRPVGCVPASGGPISFSGFYTYSSLGKIRRISPGRFGHPQIANPDHACRAVRQARLLAGIVVAETPSFTRGRSHAPGW
jgi:hypothetical protein